MSEAITAPGGLIKTAEAAALLGVSRYTLNDWCAGGTCPIPFMLLASGHKRFRRADVETYITSNLQHAQGANA